MRPWLPGIALRWPRRWQGEGTGQATPASHPWRFALLDAFRASGHAWQIVCTAPGFLACNTCLFRSLLWVDRGPARVWPPQLHTTIGNVVRQRRRTRRASCDSSRNATQANFGRYEPSRAAQARPSLVQLGQIWRGQRGRLYRMEQPNFLFSTAQVVPASNEGQSQADIQETIKRPLCRGPASATPCRAPLLCPQQHRHTSRPRTDADQHR